MIGIKDIKKLSDLEYEIYIYMSTHQDVSHMQLKEVADQLHVSPSMITRVCKKLGYIGFTEYRLDLKNQDDEYYLDGEDYGYLIDYFRKMTDQRALEPIKEAARKIASAEMIVFFGVGVSSAIAQYGADLFNRQGMRSILVSDFSHRFDVYDKHTVFVILSVSGETREVNDQALVMKRCGSQVIAITNNENTALSRISDLVISYYIPSEKNQFFYSNVSQVPPLSILEMLCKTIMKIRK